MNLDQYKSEYESEEHWQLRKKFMETHKDKFPEDKLVCLARVFFNVEFLGCRYPEKTMKLIEDLSRDVAAEYRDKKKGKLKRTFVQASDAAGAKIRRESPAIGPPNKLSKTQENPKRPAYSCFIHAELVKPDPIVDTGEFPGFIIFENCNSFGQIESCPINILMHSSNKCKEWNSISFDFPEDKNGSNSERLCEIKLNNKVLSTSTGSTVKEAKVNAAIEGLNILRKTCYTIQAKNAFYTEAPSIGRDEQAKETESRSTQDNIDNRLTQDNIGNKMMLRMGWTGGGLGKEKQGIQDPIKAAPQIMNRAGLGCNINKRQFQETFRNIFKEYIASASDRDLVFTPDFTTDERKILHQCTDLRSGTDLFDLGFEEETLSDEYSPEQDLIEDDTLLCTVCHNLDEITGLETDDNIYDCAWGMPVTPIEDEINPLPSTDVETDLEICDMVISDQSSKCIEECFSNNLGELQPSGDHLTNCVDKSLTDTRLQVNSKIEDNTSSLFNKDFGHSNAKIKVVLPDGSYKRFTVDEIRKNIVLTRLTNYTPGEEIKKLYCPVNLADLKSNKTIRELFSDFCHSSKPLENHEQLQSQITDNTKDISGDTEINSSTNKKSRKPKKLRIYFPDGSFKNVSFQCILDNKELHDHIRKSQLVTDEDLMNNESLFSLYMEHLASQVQQNVNQKTDCDKSHLKNSLQCGSQNEHFGKRSSLCNYAKPKPITQPEADDINEKCQCFTNINSGTEKNVEKIQQLTNNKYNKCKGDKRKVMRFFLPDGSFKSIPYRKVLASKHLYNISKRDKNSNKDKHVTIDDLKSSKQLRKIFSDYMKSSRVLKVRNANAPLVSPEIDINVNYKCVKDDNKIDTGHKRNEDSSIMEDSVVSMSLYDKKEIQDKKEVFTLSDVAIHSSVGCFKENNEISDSSLNKQNNNSVSSKRKVIISEDHMINSSDVSDVPANQDTAVSYGNHSSPIKNNLLQLLNNITMQSSAVLQTRHFDPTLITPEADNVNEKCQNSPVVYSEIEKNIDKEIINSNDYNKGDNRKLMRFFLPDGSFKRVPYRKVLAFKDLYQISKRDESFNKQKFVTIDDLKSSKQLRDIFSDYVKSCGVLESSNFDAPFVSPETNIDVKYKCQSSSKCPEVGKKEDKVQKKNEDSFIMVDSTVLMSQSEKQESQYERENFTLSDISSDICTHSSTRKENNKIADSVSLKLQNNSESSDRFIMSQDHMINSTNISEVSANPDTSVSYANNSSPITSDKVRSLNHIAIQSSAGLECGHYDTSLVYLENDSINDEFQSSTNICSEAEKNIDGIINGNDNKYKGGNRKVMRFFLPDGSFKRVPNRKVFACKDLFEISKRDESPNKQKHVTINDLKSSKQLREIFSDYIKSSRVLEDINIDSMINSPNVPEVSAETALSYANIPVITNMGRLREQPLSHSSIEQQINLSSVTSIYSFDPT